MVSNKQTGPMTPETELAIAELADKAASAATANGKSTALSATPEGELVGTQAKAMLARTAGAVIEQLRELRRQIDDMEQCLLEDAADMNARIDGHMALVDRFGGANRVIADTLTEIRAGRAKQVIAQELDRQLPAVS